MKVLIKSVQMYHDIIYYGHCGTHLVFTHALSSYHADKYNVRYLYRCYGKERFVDVCDGAATYSAIRVDQHVHMYMKWLCKCLLVR